MVKPAIGSENASSPDPVIVDAEPVAGPGVQDLAERLGDQHAGPRERENPAVGRFERLHLRVGRERLELGGVAAGAVRDDDIGRRGRLRDRDAADRPEPHQVVGADRALEAHLRVDALEVGGLVDRGPGRVDDTGRREDADERERRRHCDGREPAGAERAAVLLRRSEARGERNARSPAKTAARSRRAARRTACSRTGSPSSRSSVIIAHEDPRAEPAREQATQHPGATGPATAPSRAPAVIATPRVRARARAVWPVTSAIDDRAREQEHAGDDERRRRRSRHVPPRGSHSRAGPPACT